MKHINMKHTTMNDTSMGQTTVKRRDTMENTRKTKNISTPVFLTSFILVSVLISLTGCSSYQDTFDCPAGTGVGCRSVSDVNDMINQGVFDKKASPFKIMTEEGGEMKGVLVKEAEPRLISLDPELLDNASPVVRIPEQTMEVWIKGYSDEGGHYHHERKITMVVHPARWHMNPRIGS